MILNVIDRRTNIYRWKCVDVVVEPTWHDNSMPNGDQAPPDYREPSYAARRGISVAEAIAWSSSLAVPLTVYLYDEGSTAVQDSE